MKRKDYEPIKFEFFQSEIEIIMYQIEDLICNTTLQKSNSETINQWINIKDALQHKINIHKERGDWI